MTRKAQILVFLSLGLFLQLACKPKTVTLKDDLLQYLEKARLWAATEGQINSAIATVRRDQFVHDDLVVETLKPVIGISLAYTQELERYRPQTPPLANVHQEYIEAWRAHYFSIASIVDAVEKKDYIQLAKANNDLLEARRSLSDALADIARLLREADMQREPSPEEQAPSLPSEGHEMTPHRSHS